MYFRRIEDLRADHDKTQMEIADYLNMHEATLSKRLRKEVTADFERQILLAIAAIKMEKGGK